MGFQNGLHRARNNQFATRTSLGGHSRILPPSTPEVYAPPQFRPQRRWETNALVLAAKPRHLSPSQGAGFAGPSGDAELKFPEKESFQPHDCYFWIFHHISCKGIIR